MIRKRERLLVIGTQNTPHATPKLFDHIQIMKIILITSNMLMALYDYLTHNPSNPLRTSLPTMLVV